VSRSLVIVESPTKVKTIKNYLGSDYNVVATVGHIRDLPENEMGVDVENDFKPNYTTIPGKQKVISALKKAAEGVDNIYLAPDPDREGEAIAWHTAEILRKKGRNFSRILFHELTRKAILESMSHPRELDRNKYEAQQTRRILDRLVGYQISPILWKKVKSGLSAGRVQSVAVRMICERERAIQQFQSEEYWSLTALLEGSLPPSFKAKLVKKDGKKLTISSADAVHAIIADLNGANFVLDDVQTRTTKRKPLPPFITSKLQQEAIRKLKFSAKKTMSVAQELYEGIELGGGQQVGLITYMRTDSTRIAAEAAQEAIAWIQSQFGNNYTVGKPRFYANKNKAQDAHEAIRPTSVANTPEQMATYLSKDQLTLYTLIWKRFVASQMSDAVIDTLTLSIRAQTYLFTASGSTVKFAGFMALYISVDDEMADKSKDGQEKLPPLKSGEILKLHQLEPKQHFTQPPPRFSEASLVKELEENGIGRPSTYASILTTIRSKNYVELIKGYFVPSELGFIVNDLIVVSFPDVFDVDFTAKMESDLDRIETSELDSLEILNRFYEQFKKDLSHADQNMISMKRLGTPTDIDCPQCKTKKLHIKMGKNGHFLACSGYPECRYSCNYTRSETGTVQMEERPSEETVDQVCEKCGEPMVIRQGKFGSFLACSGYPACKNTHSMNGNAGGNETGVACPKSGCNGMLIQRTSKRGKVFYGCSRYPNCDYAIWDKPVLQECPQCHAPFLVEKTTKSKGTLLSCLTDGCGYRKPVGS